MKKLVVALSAFFAETKRSNDLRSHCPCDSIGFRGKEPGLRDARSSRSAPPYHANKQRNEPPDAILLVLADLGQQHNHPPSRSKCSTALSLRRPVR